MLFKQYPVYLTATLCFLGLSLGHAEEQVPPPVVAIYDLDGAVSESGQVSGGLMDLNFSQDVPLTHHALTQSLARAADDPNVKGVVLDLDEASLGLAQLEEVRRLLLDIRDAEKDVWLYTESYKNSTALIGSAATHLALMPEGNIDFSGLYTENMYFKKLLDKLGVQAQVVHIGDFKSFGETFYRTGPSEPAKKQSAELLDGIYETLVDAIAAGRGLSKEAILTVINDDHATPEELVATGLVDELTYRTDFIEKIEEHYSEEVEFDNSYGYDQGKDEITGFMDLMSVVFGNGRKKAKQEDYVALVVLEGGIDDESIAPVRTEILKAKEDEYAKALVLRVDSPGGSALSSEVLWEALEEWKETDRPFIVSMGGVAASGGYYVSAGADRIFAEKGTVTGSIGVVGMKLVLTDALAQLGITTHSAQRGKYAGMNSSTRPYTEQEESAVRDSMTDVYETFLNRVRDGRGDRLKQDAKELAGGRVYTGQKAVTIGLVDEIGGLQDALAHAAAEAELEDAPVYLFPEPKSPLDGLLSEPEESDELIKMSHQKKQSVTKAMEALMLDSSTLGLLSVEQKKALYVFMGQLRACQNSQIQLISPALPLGLR